MKVILFDIVNALFCTIHIDGDSDVWTSLNPKPTNNGKQKEEQGCINSFAVWEKAL